MRPPPFFCAPGTGALLEVQVLPWLITANASEAQLHEGDRVCKASVERSCEPMSKNCIEVAAKQGERASNREALVIKSWAASIRRECRGNLGRQAQRGVKPCVT